MERVCTKDDSAIFVQQATKKKWVDLQQQFNMRDPPTWQSARAYGNSCSNNSNIFIIIYKNKIEIMIIMYTNS